ncbi:histidine phosphatase family protein [Croceibacterium ferulae]|uniref:histidine phosphatase family protein n=1 Tax=Croceibacterium ferulae TaxID=1854641 RepID=UPI000EB0A073|nr:histidine phosphatase family protein [Croceibacterium ferulae]
MTRSWPSRLWIIRHGESAGNVARAAAYAGGAERIELTLRDMDVPLSANGRDQAAALGRQFAGRPAGERPEVLFTSPYLRALDTARLFREAGGFDPDEAICIDERLREKEFGTLDGLTTVGIARHEPQQAELRRSLGKFYHRPPGGESWCDVILRLRSFMDTVGLHHAGRPVMIFAHQVVVLCLRYILEGMDEEAILAIDRAGNIGNCAITEYRFDPAGGPDGRMALTCFNVIPALAGEEGLPTAEPRRRLPPA